MGSSKYFACYRLLCTQVKAPKKEDFQKLVYTLGYLCSTQQTALVLKPTKPMQVETYIDAAFATHDDSMLHSGVAVFVAGTRYMHHRESKSA